MLCCILAALFASPLLWWRSRADCCRGRVLPVLLIGVSLAAGVGLVCLVAFTAPGAAFHRFCTVSAWAD